MLNIEVLVLGCFALLVEFAITERSYPPIVKIASYETRDAYGADPFVRRIQPDSSHVNNKLQLGMTKDGHLAICGEVIANANIVSPGADIHQHVRVHDIAITLRLMQRNGNVPGPLKCIASVLLLLLSQTSIDDERLLDTASITGNNVALLYHSLSIKRLKLPSKGSK